MSTFKSYRENIQELEREHARAGEKKKALDRTRARQNMQELEREHARVRERTYKS